ncbi:dynein axonemal heavy chain 1-like isoform X3 [Clavelina lepadiformis]|uniref:dynein axonemal heavy chain 1-like isoform X3 n=1 Tax=Clavelina lepadiformis TaxID=159417 RepID=UPI0040423902
MNGYPNGYDYGGGSSQNNPFPPQTAPGSSRRLPSAQASRLSIRSKHTILDGSTPKQLEICQRGFYSDIINPGAAEQLGNVANAPNVEQDHLYKSLKKDHLPSVTTFQPPDEETFQNILKEQQFGPTTKLTTKTDFPTQAWQPKVQTPYYVPPGEVPRKIEIERGKRLYSKQRLSSLLQVKGIDNNKLMPKRYPDDHKVQLNKSPDPAPFPPFLPLEIFDNTEFDCRTPADWLELGFEAESNIRKPVPAKALLPTEDRVDKSDLKDPTLVYKWFNVGMLDYNSEQNLWLVQKVDDQGRILNSKGQPVVNGGKQRSGSRMFLPTQYWIPRIQLMFRAEDATVFSQRVAEAYRLRKKTEGLIRYNLYIDCMPLDHNVLKLDSKSFDNMTKKAMTTPGLRTEDPVLQDYTKTLERQVGLEFMRTMNKLTFDKVVSRNPKSFAYVTLPDPKPKVVATSGRVHDVPEYDFEEQRDSFAFNSLWTRVEAIAASGKVHTECNKVKLMSLFNTTLTKSMKLEEFEQTQSQAYTQVQLFLRDSWISTLRAVVRGSFQYVGKGWFNMYETNWEVYRISKLKKYMEMVKFCMQDSLRYLVQDSLSNFTNMILDACYQVLECPDIITWGDSIIVSKYKPKKNPLFVIDLVMDSIVHYSTPLENFEPALVGLFEKAIASTQHVPQLERYVLEELFWRGSSLLESVGAHEPHVEELRSKIIHAVRKALVPMMAYAKCYEQHLELQNLNVDEYIKEFDAQEHTAAQVKAEVDMHLLEKERLELTIPSSIIVGAFWINTENVRQSLSKKRKALANAVLQLLAKKLREQADEACEECKAISRKLYEKPNSIEELTEMRDWMKGVPEQLLQHTERIDRAMGDYELIEEFYYNLSQDDFVAKWTAIGWPKKLEDQMETTYASLQELEQHFHKLQLADQNNFQDRLDTLQMVVAGFAAHNEILKAHEVANEVRRINKQLKECQGLAQVYNQRERLFGMPVTNYDKLSKLVKDFQPYRDLWTTTSDWIRWHESWMNDPLTSIDAEQLERNVNDSFRVLHKCGKQFKDIPGVQQVSLQMKQQVEDFKPFIPLIQGLRNPGMRIRHWDALSKDLGFSVQPKATLTFSKCLEMKLAEHIDKIAKVAEVAGKEYSIEQALDKMEKEWEPINFEVKPYKETGTFIIKSPEEASQLLDDHIVMTQTMSFSPYKKPFEERISTWEGKLNMTQDVLDEWLVCQRSWLYLEPIFSSEDINRQLPVEGKRYQTMERMWRKIMKNANENTQVISLCSDSRLLENLKECNKLLEQVQKGLSEYLETKRAAFPRFYFLSDDELLEILSQTKDPTAVQPHLRKCFENIFKIKFESDMKMTEMISGEGEKVGFSEDLYPTGNVEDWLGEVERVMLESVRVQCEKAVKAYPETKRTEWVLNWPGQVVIAGSQVYWAKMVEEAITAGKLPELYDRLVSMLNDLVGLVRGKLTGLQRLMMSALIVIEVHARDVVGNLCEEQVKTVNDFEWISQIRYYWTNSHMFVRAVNAEFPYGYEYLGNTGRLVITPLTDRCYLTLTGALHLKFGGAPAGPAGTGKTETTKDLGKALAIQTVVFNCSDQLDFMAMGKFFKGLASSGAWACFDEFNRIDIEVLSVVAQQIATIQSAQVARVDRFMFEGVEISLKTSCAVFITMNPGYAGRTELPDNLKALFRPVAMMVPDYAMIAEISLYSFGFSNAKHLAKKIVTTFKLSSEQLSSQDHYDFGMRAVKTVISAAGNLKREHPDMDEEVICLRAIRDVNVPKFLLDDLKLFRGIVSDLFPKIKEEAIDYGILMDSIKDSCPKLGVQEVEGFVTKCIQLYETTVVRHGLMLVGPTCSGKTKCYNVLAKALTQLKGQPSISGGNYEAVHANILNPKSITMGQLYGEFDPMTHEWTDGILSTLIRQGVAATDADKRWYMFDGPVDAVWIENMNTVLDDNKKLCLSSGEIIKLTAHMTMMFEVADLAVASPATVSRCGMVYLEPGYIGLAPFVYCWLKRVPDAIFPYIDKLQSLFDRFLESSVQFMRKNMKEIVSSVNANLTFSLLNFLDCFFAPLIPKEGDPTLTEAQLARVVDLIEPWFFFALIWSVGGTTDNEGRVKFSEYLRGRMTEENIALQFPEAGSVYDYQLDDAGITKTSSEGDLDDEDSGGTTSQEVHWKNWMESAPNFQITPSTPYADIIVPTIDTIRTSLLIEMLAMHKKQILTVGPTGTGKTVVLAEKLLKGMPAEYIPNFMMFSAKTSANQTQDLIDGKLDKRRKGVFAPPLGKYAIFFIDDLNMPALEKYGAQPPIELIRQWMDHNGWYDRKAIGSFRTLVDISFLCAMGPPGGGRNPITARLLRHFNYIACTEMEMESKSRIFNSIVSSWLWGSRSVINQNTPASEEIRSLCNELVNCTIHVYDLITNQLLPTPAKSHYTFNLRDLSKVFQGMLMMDVGKIESKEMLLRLWYHESCRVFQDRLVSVEDRNWFSDQLENKIKDVFKLDVDAVLPLRPVLFGDFLNPNSDVKLYNYVENHAQLKTVMEDFLEDYNQVNTAQMKLVLFLDAVQHVCRISRIIRQPLGNALLLGVGGSGRQSLSRLATHIADYELFQIELAKNYGVTEWREDIKNCMLKAGLQNQLITFLFSDTQIKSESFLEDLNNILNSGDVPNIYGFDDQDNIFNAMKPIVMDQGLPPTKSNLFNAFTKRVRANLHTIVCMSPIGEVFRARLRMFPSLITCCTIDWFSEWPDEALQSVAYTFLGEITHIDTSDEKLMKGMVDMCVIFHQSVAAQSKRFLVEMSRHNYVTPTSYLELLGIFSKLIGMKIDELTTNKNRMKIGLDKLLKTADDVAKMQEELETMSPLLEEATVETVATMEKIAKDTIVAKETQVIVQKQEAEATIQAEKAQAIAADAQRDLDEALPALEAALASLKSLNKGDVTEVRALMRPPVGVRMVIEAVCIMQGVKAKKVAGEKLGTKVDDYWEPGKALLQDPAKFLESLFKYDKDNISETSITKIQPYIDNDDFMPAAIAKVSKACTSICQWVRAMHKYHHVAKSVAPKRAALAGAQAELASTQAILNEAKAKLDEVEQGIATLQEKYTQCLNKKEELETKCRLCEERLVRADKLINGLADEKIRWHDTVTSLDHMIANVIGDVMVSSGFVAYLGAFTGEYRNSLLADWKSHLDECKVPRTEHPTLVGTLGDPVKIRNWQIFGLPRDNLSVENGVIVQYSQRWPLFIDPQGQANKWVKSMEKDNGLDVIKLTDRDFLRSLENAVRFGKPMLLENVLEELDPAIEPILLKQVFKQQGGMVIKLGDAVIPYHDDFKLYITTKLPNPHYTPEVSVKVTVVNFTLAPSGLEDQLLGRVVAEERPDLEEAKNQLIVTNAKMKQELKDIEDQILYRLSASEGNPVDNVELIEVLEQSKVKAGEIKAKVVVAEQTERDIDVTRSQYIPVAVRTQILFFCVSDLANIDPMYQYSLEWFVGIFLNSIANAERADTVEKRIVNINEYNTFSLYSNVCRSLFERHKLMFAFLLCVRIQMNEDKIDQDEWRWLLAGGTTTPEKIPNPSPDWISERSWGDILMLAALPKFSEFAKDFKYHLEAFKNIFDSAEPHRESMPGSWNNKLDDFQKIIVLRCLRADKVTNAMQDYVARYMGQRFIEPQASDLAVVFKESSPVTPLIFVLSAGTDPAADLYKFAEEMRFSKKLSAISLGQGQGPRAEALIRSAMDRGKWVFFQNCHLAPSWMPNLERLIEAIDPDKVHRDFRLWLTSMPSNQFPVSILQNGSKMTIEPPRGIKANLLRAYTAQNDDFLNSCSKQAAFKSLLFSLCLFHGVAIERRKFGALGFNIPYEFTTGDLRICISQLKMFLDEYEDIPFKCLTYTAGHINYGGRVTDDWDRRCMMNILSDFYSYDVLKIDHKYSESGMYKQIDTDCDNNGYIQYIRSLPINDTPEIFGLHDNANITFAQNESFATLNALIRLQPKSASSSGRSSEEAVEEVTRKILAEVPKPVRLDEVMQKYPVLYEESMNTVLVQEVIRYNRLLNAIIQSSQDLLKAIKGLVVMSESLEKMFNSLYINEVPLLWSGKAYPSLKPLASWVEDLLARMKFIHHWIDHGVPVVFWISGFFFPQAFLTGTLQNYARKEVISIDTISFGFRVMEEHFEEIKERPVDGCFIRGLYVEGARWDHTKMLLGESKAKELYTDMATMWLIPVGNRVQPKSGIYVCPIYKTLTRAGTLSTTGHSTNYVIAVEVPTDKSQKHWVKRGVAMICALDY